MSNPHSSYNPQVYVLGFAFKRSTEEVCLILKQKPDWQKGKFNGVGGKLEPGEPPHAGMYREFMEETGIVICPGDWHRFFHMHFGNGAMVHCFAAWIPEGLEPKQMEIEQPIMIRLMDHGVWPETFPIINNLRYLIPMAWHQLNEPPGERLIP